MDISCYVGLKASWTCAGGGLPLVLARFCEERKLRARCLGLLGMERVAGAGDPLRARAGTCGGSARGPNSGWKLPRQGCREGVCGCAGQMRSEELVLGARRVGSGRGREHALCLSSHRCRALCEALLRANRCYLVGFSCAKLVRAAVKPRRFRKKDSGGSRDTHVGAGTLLYCSVLYPVPGSKTQYGTVVMKSANKKVEGVAQTGEHSLT
jgi:hypothetical protein